MCYSVSLRKKQEDIEERFGAQMQVPLLYEPYYHMSGFKHGNVYIIPQAYPDEIYPAIWGLVPEFIEGDITEYLKGNHNLNSKIENVFNTRRFKGSVMDKRCLVLADGFFEPHDHDGTSYPYFCHLEDDSLFAFAGIYTQLDDELFSCSIMTTKANGFFEEIHNLKKRMPLVFDPDFEMEWLRNDLNKDGIRELMQSGFTKEEFEAYPVTKNLYKAKYNRNTVEAITKREYPELRQKQGNLFD